VLVLKFGGTSMGSAKSINEYVTPIVVESFKRGDNPVVVVSAMTGTTNDLLALAKKSIASGKIDNETIARIKKRHEEVIATIAPQSTSRRNWSS
jgi:bifunctional aspartokinase / homoserine dehydrogenase 1